MSRHNPLTFPRRWCPRSPETLALLQAPHSFQAARSPRHRLLPSPSLRGRLRLEGTAWGGAEIRPEMHEREIGGAGVADLACDRHLRQHLDADLERRVAHVIEA